MKTLRASAVLLFVGLRNVESFVGNAAKPWATASRLYSSAKDETPERKGECVSLEYCTGCRWMLRSAWMAQELLTTFQDELDSVTLIPSRPPAEGGIFTVERNGKVVWDRKEEGGFPESKELKQRVRDLIAPKHFLGHSDTLDRQEETAAKTPASNDCKDCPDDPAPAPVVSAAGLSSFVFQGRASSPHIAITYCTGCRWLLRASWFMQELLTTFDTELNSVTLIPSRPPAPGGTFLVELDGEVIWDRSTMGGFPKLKELKQIIRDKIAPSHDLGHSDKKPKDGEFEPMDDDEAADMRQFFGVA